MTPEFPSACIFDLDGVICDTAKYHFHSWQIIAGTLDIQFDHAMNESLKGVSRVESLKLLLKWGNMQVSESRFNELLEKKNEHYIELISQMSPDEIFPGVLEFIQELKETGVLVALGSASKNARIVLKKLNITQLFDAIVDGRHVTESKPSPEVFLLAARKLSVSPEKCFVFEDASVGIQAAVSAGMRVIGIGDPKVLNGADFHLKGLDQLDLATFKRMIINLN
jgi:beta-phosphoglucomutase